MMAKSGQFMEVGWQMFGEKYKFLSKTEQSKFCPKSLILVQNEISDNKRIFGPKMKIWAKKLTFGRNNRNVH